MIPFPLILEIRKAVICHGASIWCCNWCCKKKSDRNYWQIHGKKKLKFSFDYFSTGFRYKVDTTSNLFLSYGAKQDQKRGVVYQFRIKCAWLSSNITVFFQASKFMPACSQSWTSVSLERGFKFGSCANGLSVRSKTSRDASKDHYLAFPSKKEMLLCEDQECEVSVFWCVLKSILQHDRHRLHKPY
jgi:hypothetical protein